MLAGRQQEIQAERLDVGCRRAALGGGTDREWKNQAAGGRGAVGWKQPVLWLPSAKTTALLQRCGESAATATPRPRAALRNARCRSMHALGLRVTK